MVTKKKGGVTFALHPRNYQCRRPVRSRPKRERLFVPSDREQVKRLFSGSQPRLRQTSGFPVSWKGRASRMPRLLFRLSGELLFRLAGRQFNGLLK
ncbi:MAG: hypothetical protein EPO28_11665 [Saprospiraceae bacterium]|nr:MAG: hypothetical protein EPO28_11665 [Saprospiraceae bacterium]